MQNKKNKKTIGIDARFYGPTGKGLGRYVQELVDNIINIDQDNEYVVYLSQKNFDEFVIPISMQDRIRKQAIKAGWYGLSEQFVMPYYFWKDNLDLVHIPHFNVPVLITKKFIVTIHDLILTKFPTIRATTLNPWLYRIKDMAYRIVIWLAIKRAKKIIAVSEYTKKDIIENFRVDPKKISVTLEGVANLAKGRDNLFVAKLDKEETLSEYKIDNPFLLYVGNAYPHKNLEGLINVFCEIYKDNVDLRLVLVGKEDYFYKRTKEYARALWQSKNNPVIFAGYVPDAKLEILFKNALAYVFPSFYEGFGLPPLEAMARGCPVVSSNKTSMPEILEEACVYFDPDNQNDMKEKIKIVINDKALRDELIRKGYEQVKKYNWWDCALKTQAEYSKIIYKDY